MIFRELNKQETEEFKQWARDNYKLGDDISELWHPVLKAECEKIKIEYNKKTNDYEQK